METQKVAMTGLSTKPQDLNLESLATQANVLPKSPENAKLIGFTLHFRLRSITPVATKVHTILQSFVVLTWMCVTIELV